jgi:hypothetical protein
LAAEWLALIVSGLMLLVGVRAQWALRLAAVSTLVGLTQRFSNQQVLLMIVLSFAVLSPLWAHAKRPIDSPTIGLIRAQLLIVYVFSALNKLTSGFLDGGALLLALRRDSSATGLALLEALPMLSEGAPALRVLAGAVVGVELLLPLVLLIRPWCGVVTVGVLHAGFAVIFPGVLPFSVLMVAMSFLFVRPARGAGAALHD